MVALLSHAIDFNCSTRAWIARYHCGQPASMWGILNPGEDFGPGVLWSNPKSCIPNEGRDFEATVEVDYLCPTPLERVHLHQCKFSLSLWQKSLVVHTVIAGFVLYHWYCFAISLSGTFEGHVDSVDVTSSEAWNHADAAWTAAAAAVIEKRGGIVATGSKNHAQLGDGPPPLARDAAAYIANSSATNNEAAATLSHANSPVVISTVKRNGQRPGERPMVTTVGHLPIRSYIHLFESGECKNGLPPGSDLVATGCFVSLRWAEHCGMEYSWEALIPSLSLGEQAAALTSKGSHSQAGVRWTSAEACTSVRAAVDYFCPLLHSTPRTAASGPTASSPLNVEYTLPDAPLLLDKLDPAAADESSPRAKGSDIAEPRPLPAEISILPAQVDAETEVTTLPMLHRCTFKGSFESVGQLSDESCGRRYHNFVQTKLHIDDESVPDSSGDFVSLDPDTKCLFLPFHMGPDAGTDSKVWNCTNSGIDHRDGTGTDESWRSDILHKGCLVSVNKFTSACLKRNLQRKPFDPAQERPWSPRPIDPIQLNWEEQVLVVGDAIFKDWAVAEVSWDDVSFPDTNSDDEVSSILTSLAEEDHEGSNTSTVAGLRWAYSGDNGHDFAKCLESRVEVRADILCPPV